MFGEGRPQPNLPKGLPGDQDHTLSYNIQGHSNWFQYIRFTTIVRTPTAQQRDVVLRSRSKIPWWGMLQTA
jgi:hypothetical protein